MLSTFGVMFTPNPERSAAELVRVCRPGGRIGLANWTPEGFIGQMFKIVGAHVPPPRRRALAARSGAPRTGSTSCSASDAKVDVHAKHFTFRYRSAEDFFETFKTYYGPHGEGVGGPRRRRPAVAARPARRAGRAAPTGTATGTLTVDSEYLEVVATRYDR